MILGNVDVAVLIFSLISLLFAFVPYKKYVKSKVWWAYAFSGHAVLLSGLASLFSILGFGSNILKLVAGGLLIVSSLGLMVLYLAYSVENKKFLFKFWNLFLVWIHHTLMSVVGVWLLFSIVPMLNEVMYSITLLLLYALFMSDRLNVPWILYKPSRMPVNARKILIRTFMAVFYILLPVLSFVTKG